MADNKITVVIPMRNERAAVGPLFERLGRAVENLEQETRVLIVDGASSDGTPDEVTRVAGGMTVEVLTLTENLGLGGALDAGLQRAVPAADCIVTMDGDDSHDPATIRSLIQKIEEGYDFVIASRFQPGGEETGVPVHRRLLSHSASRLLRTLFPFGPVRDYSSGFRAYRTAALRRVQGEDGRVVTEEGFTCMLELLLKLREAGARPAEVPLVLRYDRRETDSKMEVGPTVAGYLRLIGRSLARSRRTL